MFQHVIVGIDGAEGGRDALALAQALEPAQLTLLVAYPAERARWRRPLQGYFERLRDDAERVLGAARAEAGAGADAVACPDPSPARALQAQAAERHADLVVVGSSRHGPLARLVLGDVGRGVLHDAPCPVAVAPRGFAGEPHDLRRVAVGFDGSPEARAALALGAGIAEDRSGVLTVHMAWDLPPVFFGGLAYAPDVEEILQAERAHATEVVEAALADLPRADRRVTRGAAGAILEEAARESDLLVVGSRGWGPARRIALGSTSDHLVHRAACPVVVVPRPAAVEDDDRAQDGEPAASAAPEPQAR